MDGSSGELAQRTVTCPKCGTENLNWRAACTNCGERLHPDDDKLKISYREGIGSILIFVPDFIAAGFFTFFVVNVAKSYPFLWGMLPIPWIVVGISLKWRLIGGILSLLVSALPYIAFSMVMNVNSGEALGIAMVFPFIIVLFNGPLLTSAIILVVIEIKEKS